MNITEAKALFNAVKSETVDPLVGPVGKALEIIRLAILDKQTRVTIGCGNMSSGLQTALVEVLRFKGYKVCATTTNAKDWIVSGW